MKALALWYAHARALYDARQGARLIPKIVEGRLPIFPKLTAAPDGKLSGAAEGMDSGRTPNRSSLVKTR